MSKKLLSTYVLCGLTLLLLPSGRAQAGTPASELVGSWEFTLTPNLSTTPKTISGLATFTSDGTVIETDTSEVVPIVVSTTGTTVFGTPGHGIWQPGPVFGMLFVQFTNLFANLNSTLHSKRIVTMTVKLNSTGDQFSGGYSFEIDDPTGHHTGGSGTVAANLMRHPLLP